MSYSLEILLFQSLDVEFEYGFEYLGSSSREVITPLTERTFVSLIQIYQLIHGMYVCGSYSTYNSFEYLLYVLNLAIPKFIVWAMIIITCHCCKSSAVATGWLPSNQGRWLFLGYQIFHLSYKIT